MKKSHLSVKLVILSLASVVALTACQRRERPAKAKPATTEQSSGENGVEKSGEQSSNEGQLNDRPLTQADDYAQSLAAIETAQNIADAEGYTLDPEKQVIDYSTPWEKYAGQDGQTKDTADQYVACHLKGLLAAHESFLHGHSKSRPESVTEEAHDLQVKASEAIVTAINNSLRDNAYLMAVDCSTPSAE